jgi:hypothetical protein
MKLKVLHETQKFKVAAVMNGDACETESFFDELDQKYQATADGIFDLIDHIAQYGLDGLPSKLFHLVDQENKIFELIKGDIRLLCFKGHGSLLIVTTHAFIKKSQKTKNTHKEKAIRHKKQYQLAHDRNEIVLVRDPEE